MSCRPSAPHVFAFGMALSIMLGAALAPLSGSAARAQGFLPPGDLMRPGGSVPGAPPANAFVPTQPASSQAAPLQAAPAQSAPAQAAPAQAATAAPAPLPPQRPAGPPPGPRVATPAPAPFQAAPSAPAGPAQQAVVERVTNYYNSIQSLTGTFVQVDPDGTRKTGDFYMQKPGRVRFEYNAPSPIELIANGQSVAVRDRKLNTQDITPLSQTPLRFLLAERVDLARDPHVVGVYQDNLYVTVVMEEKVPMLGTYRLLILFDAKDYALKQWIVTDPQGYDTSVALSGLDANRKPDPKLFVINFERMLQ